MIGAATRTSPTLTYAPARRVIVGSSHGGVREEKHSYSRGVIRVIRFACGGFYPVQPAIRTTEPSSARGAS